MQKRAIFTIISTTLLISLKSNFTKSSKSSMYINPFF